ncbi:nuclease-related domain-containing protein [Luteimonas mephitis]|uniref:nuclease-related domain-containing protein n=1 Tax=Luteimonas mephitis TaxID=83615 RepID=UPI003A8E5B27
MTGNFVMICSFVLSLLLMIIGILAFKYWRRREARRSPLHGKKLANLPGQQLATRINDHGDNLLLAGIVMYLSFPAMLFAWATTRVQWETAHFGTADWLFVIGAICLFAFGMWRYAVHWDARTRARDGLVAEQMTGQLLNRLIGPDSIVAHDLPCEGFNIDHIVIAPRAVYAVETKSFRKPRGSANDSHYKVTFDGEALRFPDWRDEAPITQARRQAKWLARYLSESLGREIPVTPAIALPGWWIDRTEESKRSDVRVFTPMGKGADFLLAGQEVLDDSTRTLVAQAVALRYPAIEN